MQIILVKTCVERNIVIYIYCVAIMYNCTNIGHW